ncbi:hypothetical protein DNTS_034744 [Danionella cerebrum]|uniref:Uncharacterized protein n=1 Tax=Danionella cerebrum TaxID=2873325 RepID=A0A553RJ76_9TELE|nr:hypothetical protein DNTS_034744 [Danionella translucida]
MGLCCLTHQLDALSILNGLRFHITAGNGEDGGPGREASAPGKVTPQAVGTPRPRTIAERALENCFSRLLEILSQLVSIERDFIKHLSYGTTFKLKDSIDLKNICLRMAVAEPGSCSNRDLKELRECLRIIVDNLLAFAKDENNLSSTLIVHRLRELSNSFPEI